MIFRVHSVIKMGKTSIVIMKRKQMFVAAMKLLICIFIPVIFDDTSMPKINKYTIQVKSK